MPLNRPPVLGRGLDALFGAEPQGQTDLGSELKYIDINLITQDPEQPRKHFDAEKLQELSRSIRDKGILQPLIVRRDDNQNYVIIAGERRWRAAQLAELKEVPVLIKSWRDEEVLEVALIENIQRENLTPLEEAAGFQRLIDYGYTQDKVARTLNISRSYIANSIRLLSLSPKIQNYINSGMLTVGHARTLINHPQADALADTIISQGLTVRHSEHMSQKNKDLSTTIMDDPDIMLLQERLENALKMKVKLNYKNGAGYLKINFKSLKQLNHLVDSLNGKSA